MPRVVQPVVRHAQLFEQRRPSPSSPRGNAPAAPAGRVKTRPSRSPRTGCASRCASAPPPPPPGAAPSGGTSATSGPSSPAPHPRGRPTGGPSATRARSAGHPATGARAPHPGAGPSSAATTQRAPPAAPGTRPGSPGPRPPSAAPVSARSSLRRRHVAARVTRHPAADHRRLQREEKIRCAVDDRRGRQRRALRATPAPSAGRATPRCPPRTARTASSLRSTGRCSPRSSAGRSDTRCSGSTFAFAMTYSQCSTHSETYGWRPLGKVKPSRRVSMKRSRAAMASPGVARTNRR